jgi:hypothetical protein
MEWLFTTEATTAAQPHTQNGAEGSRTLGLCSAIAALSQLSYRPGGEFILGIARREEQGHFAIWARCIAMVGGRDPKR